MRRLAALATVAVLALAGTTATDAQDNNSNAQSTPLPLRCSIDGFRPLSAAVWRPKAWRRGQPPGIVLRAVRQRLECAPPKHRTAMRRTWHRDKAAFYETRRRELWRERVTPYPGEGRWWALPFYIVVCESGVRGYVTSGYYGLLVSTWVAWGGTRYASVPGEASKREQDLIAHRVWADVGPSGWECA